METRKWLALFSIVLCVFIFNMSEFIPIGLLTGISDDFGISESAAGLIISIYAWAVALLSLPMMLILRRMEFRRMMLMCTSVFLLFQLVSGLSATFHMLIVSRIGVALAHAVFWSIAPSLAVRIVDLRYQKVALSLVSGGTSVAMIVGLPLGRVIGLAMGWRMAFVTITFISLAALVMLFLVFPRVENPGTFTLKRLPEIYTNKTLVCIYIALAIFITGCYTGYSYIEPFMDEVAGMGETEITVALILFGCAGFIGGALFAKVYGKCRFLFLPLALAGVTCALLLMKTASGNVLAVYGICILWGTCITCFNTSYQNETIWATSPDAVPIAMSLFSGIYNVGIAMGAIVGGRIIDGSSVADVGDAGGMFTLAATLIVLLVLIPILKKKRESRQE